MRVRVAVFTICAAGAAALPGLTVRANEKPTEAYQQAMKDLGAANAQLRGDVTAIEKAGAYPDYNPIDKDVEKLRASFAVALEYWQARKVDDAVAKVQAVMKTVDSLEAAKKEKDYDALMTAAAEIGKSCGGCHAAHRDKLPDGAFEIK